MNVCSRDGQKNKGDLTESKGQKKGFLKRQERCERLVGVNTAKGQKVKGEIAYTRVVVIAAESRGCGGCDKGWEGKVDRL